VITTEGQSGNRTIQKAAVDQKIRFWHQLGYDAFWLGADFELPELTRISTQDTAALPRQKRRWVDEKAGAICDWEDFDRYPWPRTEEADFFPLEYAARRLPEGIGIIAHISGVLEPVMWLMGYETFALMLYDDPGLVEAMFAKIKEIFVPLAASLVQMEGVIALWMGDDMGFKTGTMVAPQHLRSLVFPIQKQIATLAHRQGMPFLLHSCGNLEAVLDDLIDDVGIDARHSFEDVIEPVELFVSRYGERISVIGGVDVDLLSRGTEAQVRTRTREILERCSPSRGYVLGSGNSIANYVQPQNYLAMLDEGWRFNCGM
jgi:uroporphyrinogen decarboxylase